jgi:hypothetical protein
MSDNIKISWDYTENLVGNIAQKMIGCDFTPDIVLAILRGGIVPARLLCNYFEKSVLFSVNAKLYDKVDDWQTEAGYLGAIGAVKVGKIDIPVYYGKEKILIIDDISDSGNTFSAVVERIYDEYPVFNDFNNVKTASLYLRKGSIFVPDFYGEEIVHKKWIDFPWEKK